VGEPARQTCKYFSSLDVTRGDVFLPALHGSKQSEHFCIFSPFRLFSGNLDRLLGVKLKVGQDVGYHLPMFSFAALRNFGPIH